MGKGRPPSLALLLTGFLRHADKTLDALTKHVASAFDTKLFVATWDVADDARGELVRENKVDRTPVTTHDVCDRFGPRLADCRVLAYDLFERTVPRISARHRSHDLLEINERAKEHNVYWMNRLFAQWYMVRQGLLMIEEHERLHGRRSDLICRTRTDILFSGALPEWSKERILVASALPAGMATDRDWVPDFFSIGPAAEMRKLADLCWSIEKMYDRQNIDTTNAENLLIHFLVGQDIPLSIKPLPYTRI